MESIEHIKDKVENIFEEASTYAEARWNLGVLNMSSKLADTVSTMATTLLLAMVGLTVLLFMSLAVAWLIGEKLNSLPLGLFLVGLFYVIIGGVIYSIKDKYIKLPVINLFIKKFYHED
ncbi:putative superfamily III holin-X [Arcicella aurantiaca]|uniref:Putative superfamily III holin-X n=1 Tax=Arcicella aurantiaca TaxID=591202 RepID=A0A316EQ47_9BACT|nr:phage holin family protein [Arcicella aurantiaca]PWK25170.1 putative superfamily III holin-X [Arcicella aurantiaca]